MQIPPRTILITSLSPKPTAQFTYPQIMISATHDINGESEALGIVLIGYRELAEKFIKNHPDTCTSCPAYVMHIRIRKTIDDIMKQMEKEVPNAKE